MEDLEELYNEFEGYNEDHELDYDDENSAYFLGGNASLEDYDCSMDYDPYDFQLKFFDGTSKKIFIREAEDGSFSFEITDELLSEFSKLLKVEVEEGREILYSLLMATTEMLPYSVSKEELEEVKKYSIY